MFKKRISLATTSTEFYAYSGAVHLDVIVMGGSEFAADGVPARMSFCMRTPSGGSAQAAIVVAGQYLD